MRPNESGSATHGSEIAVYETSMAAYRSPASAVTLESSDLGSMSKNERIKLESQGLFFVSENGVAHTFLDEVEALDRGESPSFSKPAKELSKFFGIYTQRARGERGNKTDDHFFMVRIKNPAGGQLSSSQWAALDDAAERFGDGTLRITSRQSIQFHHVSSPDLAALVRHLNRHYRDQATLGACGDVNRNVMTSPIDGLDGRHDCGGRELASAIADELSPKASAYFQIFRSDGEGRNLLPIHSDEPIYGAQYLPRKFKIGIGYPTDNSIDVLTQDVGFMPVVRNRWGDGLLWDFYSGGGLGLTHNNSKTAPLLGLYLGRIRREQVVEAARAIAILQKENGERRDRKQARWKYTIRRLGMKAVKAQLKSRFDVEIEEAEPAPIPPMRLHLGWHEQVGGKRWYGVPVENGRIRPELRKALRRAVEEFDLSVRLTPQQDVLLCDVDDRTALERFFETHGVPGPGSVSVVRRNAMACPAKPTCGLAMTEAERVLPSYLDAIEEAGLGAIDVVIRMTGCPNNCVRPPTAEVGIYGYGKNDHVVLVGGTREGTRIGRELYSRLPEEKMIPMLTGLLRAIRDHNTGRLSAGEFLYRTDPDVLRAWIDIEGGGGSPVERVGLGRHDEVAAV
jgi:sulfite reductase (ferredoxin)